MSRRRHDTSANSWRRTRSGSRALRHTYSSLFYLPAGIIYTVIFVVPTVMSFYFAFTRWTLFDATFTGLDNFRQFFSEQALRDGLWHTVVYAVVTSGLKVVLGMLLAVLLTSSIRVRGLLRSLVFFPVLVSTIKLRQAGFHECVDTEDMFRRLFARMQARRLLPPR